MPIKAVNLPFNEQAQFFKRKLNLPTESWADIYTQEHDWAFVVAGANRDALVADFRTAVDKVIQDGATLEQFRKDFDSIVQRHGWSYNGGRNWRSRVIYETNLNSSYQAGRYEQLQAVKEDRPYWQYVHNDAVEHPRPLHQSWNGLILHADDPFWNTHFPPNGWGCQCRVIALSESDLKRMGRTVDEAPDVQYEEKTIGARSPNGPRGVRVPEGIDPGFEYIPGKAILNSAVPPESPNPPIKGSSGGKGLSNTRPIDQLPVLQKLSTSMLLSTDLTPTQYAEAFLNEFGATLDAPAIYNDVIGESLVVGANMFTTSRTGEIKADKNGRGPFMKLLAYALQSPDEIWARIEYHYAQKKSVVRRRYVTRILLPDSEVPALTVFEYGADGWTGITAFTSDDTDINDMRIGVRLYRRRE